jgi:glyoxylase-like metal-dependent hydrolase (beta-lactamase superfamily II)
MLRQIAPGVQVHESRFCQSNAVVVSGRDGVLLVDAGVHGDELACLAHDLSAAGQAVVAGFSTHPHWDHLLWAPSLGEAPRYGTALCASTILELLGNVTGLPAATARIPWDGPAVRILEHRAHAPGHAALLIEEHRVLVAGDMLSDVLIPMLDVHGGADPVEDYLAALRLFQSVAGGVDAVVPGHGSIAGSDRVQARIDQDRAYVLAIRDGRSPADPRIGPAARPGWEWVGDVHAGQLQGLARRG